MPDKTTAAVWFTEQVLSDKFKQLARARSFKITEFNEKILEMSRSHHQAVNSGKFCSQCNSLFVGQSKPAQCSRCQHLVHRKCIKDHSTSCNITSDKVDNSSSPNFSPSRPHKRVRISDQNRVEMIPVTKTNDNVPSPPFMNTFTTNQINSGVATFTGKNTRISFVPEAAGGWRRGLNCCSI